MLTWLTKRCRPHLSERLHDAFKVLKGYLAFPTLVQQTERLPALLLFCAIKHYINVAEVLVKRDAAVIIVVHYCKHTVRHETQAISSNQPKRLLILLQAHLRIDCLTLKSLCELIDLIIA